MKTQQKKTNFTKDVYVAIHENKAKEVIQHSTPLQICLAQRLVFDCKCIYKAN